MATKIIHKKSSVAGKIPLASDLEVGEIALNLEDKLIYSKQTDGTVVEMSPSESSSVSTGSWTLGSSTTVGWAVTEAGGVLVWKYGTTVAFQIDNNGNVTIAGDLYLNQAIGGNTDSEITGTDWGYHEDGTNFYFQRGSTNLMRITSTGDLYIAGDLDSDATITSGTATSYYFTSVGGANLEITSAGDVNISGDISTS